MKYPSRRLSWCLGALALGALGVFSCLGNLRQAQLQTIVTEPVEAPPLVEEVYDFELAPGSWRELDGTKTHVYNVELRPGDVLRAFADQEEDGPDVEVSLHGPDGSSLFAVDSPNDMEEVFFVAKTGGTYQAKVYRIKRTGRYRFYREPIRQAVDADHTRSEAEERFHRARVLAKEPTLSLEAIRLFQEAADLWQRLRDVVREVDTYRRIGDEYFQGTEYSNALGGYEKALGFRVTPLLLNSVGNCHKELGDLSRAEHSYNQALGLARTNQDKWAEASALNNLGKLYEQRGEFEEALGSFDQALRLFKELRDHGRIASVLNNIGFTYFSQGLPELALQYHTKVLDLVGEAGDGETRAAALDGSARAFTELERYDDAVTALEKALLLRRETDNEAVTLSTLGWTYLKQKDFLRAQLYFEESRVLFEETEDARALATAWLNLGTLYLMTNKPRQALEHYEQALPIAQRADFWEGQAVILRGIAEAQNLLGNPGIALEKMWEALHIVETVRGKLDQRDLQVNFLASKHSFFEFFIDLLMSGSFQGGAEQALLISERSRARTLLDAIAGLVSPEPLVRPKRLLSLQDIQRELDKNTVLLEYYLGDEEGYLFMVTSDRLEAHLLPGLDEIDPLARKVHGYLGSPLEGQKGSGDKALEQLSQVLLEPVAQIIKGKRLLIVPHESLQLISFATLLDLSSKGNRTRLGQVHEIVYAPSVSVLAELRRQRILRVPPTGRLAIFADPVFNEEDQRFQEARITGEFKGWRGDDLSRLKHTRAEAEAILAIVGEDGVLRLEGFEVTYERITNSNLSDYRILHFATHGLLGETSSSLELSRINAEGEQAARDSLLPPDIESLKLAADLVVLSACSTALGKEFKGEGMMGLPHAFLYAGASGVLVSLWDVNDQATSRLMELFYRGIFEKKLHPAKALLEAQRAMSQDSDWSDPFYWGGFILVGDWR